MATRTIDNLFCIFDMTICRALNLSCPISTRAIIAYDRDKGTKDIRILNREIEGEIHNRLLSWMHKNIHADNIVHHLSSNEIDMDQLATAAIHNI
jgi:hypothetical protein